MKIFSQILLSLFILSCKNDTCSDKPITGYIAIDTSKSLSELYNERDSLINKELDRIAGVSEYNPEKHISQLRIYSSFRNSQNDKLLLVERSKEGWSAKEIRYWLSFKNSIDTLYLGINSIETLSPHITWQSLHDSLQRWNFYNLPGDSLLVGYAEPMDGDGVGVIYEDGLNYNRFRYRNIDLNRSRFKEVEAFEKMLNFIDSSFDKKYIYKSCSSPEEKKMD